MKNRLQWPIPVPGGPHSRNTPQSSRESFARVGALVAQYLEDCNGRGESLQEAYLQQLAVGDQALARRCLEMLNLLRDV
jgi:hypothetical protein